MKKVLIALAVASVFTACSDSSTKTDTIKDSTGVVNDTTLKISPSDTSLVKDTMHIKMDTTGKNRPGTKDTVIKK